MGMEQGEYIDGNGGADFTYGYGAGGDEFAVDYAAVYGGTPDYAPGFEPIPFAPYEPTMGLEPPQLEPIPESPIGGGDLFNTYLDYYLDLGYSPLDAVGFAAEDASAGSIAIPTYEQSPLPDISPFPFYGLPYFPDPFLTPYTPTFPEYGLPPPPEEPRLPGYCPSGYYHPIDDPYTCVPFPAQTTQQQQQQQQKPPAQQQPAPTPSKPPSQQQQQQACPTGYCKHPTTGQCIPIPQGYTRHPQTQVCTPVQQQQQTQQQCPTGYCKHPTTGQCMPIPAGYYRHSQTQVCTALTPQASPLPIPTEAEDLFSNLKNLPWWIWLALAGLFLLSRDEDGKKTTVTYRRAT